MLNRLKHYYHLLWAYLSALWYRFPSRKLKVIGVTGTKGKTTTVELMAYVFASAGHSVVSSSGLQFRIGEKVVPNDFKMTMPGRGFLQGLLARGVKGKCDIAILEITSEGLIQSRHGYIDFDAAIFLGIHEEHLERHGGFEGYRRAKELLFGALQISEKEKKISIINTDDVQAKEFVKYEVDEYWGFGFKGNGLKKGMKILKADGVQVSVDGLQFYVNGNRILSKLLGEFNVYNVLAVIATAKAFGIDDVVLQNALQTFPGLPGRMEVLSGRGIHVIVDYAHTPDSLEWVYKEARRIFIPLEVEATRSEPSRPLMGFNPPSMICILGSAGGGRDTWKRPVFGELAAMYCDHIVLTNEDPYDEDPERILDDIKEGIDRFSHRKVKLSASSFNTFQEVSGETKNAQVHIVLERKEAIKKAISLAKPGDVVVITGKGGERWMVVAGGKKIPWDDSAIVKEILYG
ncbi:MAG: UDP-N-acetylmuramyl-tripeptide synthetase [Parcubacteria group bacterium]|nr:UDP-N-acetylmuramyl-tripeptide synthetase [Parcubacteria group bacterium]